LFPEAAPRDLIMRHWHGGFRPYLLLLLIAAGTVFFRLGGLPLTGADEPRYARIAEEMYRSGKWITPTLEGDPWLEKPPLYYWMTIPSYALSGVSETTARIAQALCALVTLWVTCWAGSRLWTPRAGLLGGVITATSIGFCVYGRGGSIDMPFTACCTVCFALLAVSAGEGSASRSRLVLAYAALGLAVLAKGPLALVLAAGVVILFWGFDERGGCIRKLHLVPGLMLAAAVAAPWFWMAFRQNGFSFLAVFFINHNLARYVSEVHHHVEPFYYYVPVVLALVFPWTGFLLALVPRAAMALKNRRHGDPGRLFAACWFLFPVLVFSLSGSKLPGYVLVSLPALALLMAAALSRILEDTSSPRPGVAAGGLHLLTSCGIAIAVPLLVRNVYQEEWTEALPPVLAVLVPGLAAAWALFKGKWRSALVATALQGLILVLTLALFSFPMLGRHYSTRDIARQAVAVRQGTEPIILYRFFHHAFYYYTGYQVAADLQDVEALATFAHASPHILIVTESQYVPEIGRIPGFSVRILGRQGKLCLLRMLR
jgi:4-amino-4-deoxy-L-arabinose transferase-like glycosyltransferase